MLIAQLSVAGEGQVHPLDLQTLSVSSDQTALDDFVAQQSNLPWVVFRAAHRAASFPALPARARAVLAALARTVDAHQPYAAIFARRELLTGRSMQSMRTFYRSLDDLESAGLIERAPQRRYGQAGLFGRAYLHLTERSAKVLGYVDTVQISNDAQPACSKPADACNTLSPSFAVPCVTVADRAIYKDLLPKNQKRQPASLPADLERLLSLGFHRNLIFKLMREAKTQAKLLSEVVEATWDHLKAAQHPISYLRALLRNPVDFGHQVRVKLAAAAERHLVQNRHREMEKAIRTHAGKRFTDRDGKTSMHVSEDGETISVFRSDEHKPRVAVHGWQERFVEAVRGGKLVSAQSDVGSGILSRVSAEKKILLQHVPDPQSIGRTMTDEIQTHLGEMKRLLKATCAGVRLTDL